ncbi:MAG: TIGR03905 family TSCPD domain-containing protein [Oscillospiraceae bacterium]|nr:TIGR03905 family TSCPD domain-containing protein [Oscillospiraceae bacterium]
MTYEYNTSGTCSKKIILELSEDNVIESVKFIGGCHGNLQGISSLVKGMKADEVVARLEGIKCGFKSTSCPDQLSKAVKQAMEKKA